MQKVFKLSKEDYEEFFANFPKKILSVSGIFKSSNLNCTKFPHSIIKFNTSKLDDVQVARITNNSSILLELRNIYGCLDCLKQIPIPEDLLKLEYQLNAPNLFIKNIRGYELRISWIPLEEFWSLSVYNKDVRIGIIDIYSLQALKDFEQFIIKNY
jgi:hypothetical protein